MSTLQDLTNQVDDTVSVASAAVAFIKSIPARIAAAVAAAGSDPAALPNLAAKLKASSDELQAALDAIGPSADSVGTISGSINPDGANATVTISGDTDAQVTANASGNYQFKFVKGGHYVVTPTKQGFAFSPTSQNVSVNDQPGSSVSFTSFPV